MSRNARMFERLGGEGAFGAFLMLGDPDLETSAALLDAVVEGGADMVEVGIPFSDPIADGPVIQAAAMRAIEAGVRTADCFRLIADFRARHPDIPVGILTYANLVMARGRKAFFELSVEAGADSLLVADLPSIEAQPWAEEMMEAGLDPVLIAASNTPADALARIAGLSRAYVYCVTRAGVTGTHSQARFDAGLIARLDGAAPPIFGFGISTPDHVRSALRAGAGGVICGSAIVDCAARGGDVRALVASLKAATRNDSASS
jgi:tryptophan synthase alpha chain